MIRKSVLCTTRKLVVLVVACAFWASLVFAGSVGDGAKSPIIFVHGIGVPSVVYETVVPLKRVFGHLGYDLYVAGGVMF